MNTGTPTVRWSANGTNALARRVAPDVLKTIREFSAALCGAPVPLKALLAHAPLKVAADNVRRTAGVKGYPYNRTLLSEALQHLRKAGDIKSSKEGWVLTGATVEPTVTLDYGEFRTLMAILDLSMDTPEGKALTNKVLRAIRYRKE